MVTASTPAEPQLQGDPLPRTMDTIKQSCERFRVLVLGKEGVGKSTLINRIFKVDLAQESEYTAGDADIKKELSSPENESFVLHDSRGYGAGEVNNFKKLTEFINNRTGNSDVGARLHAIWLCIATPTAGGRVLETGDEKIFQVVQGKIPIIVVFTRYDDLVMKEEFRLHETSVSRTEDELQSLAKTNASQTFEEDCIIPMKNVGATIPCVYVSTKPHFEETLQNLVKTTLHYINPGEHPLPQVTPTNHSESSKRHSRFRSIFSFKSSKKAEPCEPVAPITDAANSVSIMLATAQRVVLDSKVKASVSVGHRKYWRGLASGVNFMGKDLRRCLEVIHDDIVIIWNFRDLPMLRDEDFSARISKLVAGLEEQQGPSPNEQVFSNAAKIAGAVGTIATMAVGAANPIGFAVAPIVVGAVFAKWVYDIYRATPGILRCFMAYIVDLIIIMQMIFVISETRANGVVKPEEVEDVLKRFETDLRINVHQDIRKFVRDMGVVKAVVGGKDVVFDKMVKLIDNHRTRGEGSERVEAAA